MKGGREEKGKQKEKERRKKIFAYYCGSYKWSVSCGESVFLSVRNDRLVASWKHVLMNGAVYSS